MVLLREVLPSQKLLLDIQHLWVVENARYVVYLRSIITHDQLLVGTGCKVICDNTFAYSPFVP
jgi:hypothetical protein